MSISESVGSVFRNKKRLMTGCVSAATLLVAMSSALPGRSYALKLGEPVPDFEAISTEGNFKLHELIEKEQKYIVFFSHPRDFTPVCTTELAEVHNLKPVLDSLNAMAIGFSVDSLANHEEWQKDILSVARTKDEKLNFPLISDETLEISKLLDMLPAEAEAGAERTAKDNKTARTVLIIGPDKGIRMMLTYPMTAGRDFAEIVRVLHAIVRTDTRQVATPANWEPGDDVVVLPTMSKEDAEAILKNVRTVELPSGKDYLRFGTLPEDEEAESEEEEGEEGEIAAEQAGESKAASEAPEAEAAATTEATTATTEATTEAPKAEAEASSETLKAEEQTEKSKSEL